MRQDGLQEAEEDVYTKLGEDQGAGNGPPAAGKSFGVDVTTGPDGGLFPVDGDSQGGAFHQEFGFLLLSFSVGAGFLTARFFGSRFMIR